MRRSTTLLSAFLVVALLSVSHPAAATEARPSGHPRAGLPPAAVAMGDSFIAGTGAADPATGLADYQSDDAFPFQSMVGPQAFSDPFFCFRSRHALIEVAELEGIAPQHRFNVACDGAFIEDLRSPSGRRVGLASQIDQALAVAQNHDVQVFTIAAGSNGPNRRDFGAAAIMCLLSHFVFMNFGPIKGRAIAQRATAELGIPIDNDGRCALGQYFNLAADGGALRTRDDELERATIDLIDRLATLQNPDGQQLYPEGSYNIVLMGYANPLAASSPDPSWSDRRSGSDAAAEARWNEAYMAGCPVHAASFGQAKLLTDAYNRMVVAEAAGQLRLSRPASRVTYLDVTHAFDGRRLCDRDPSGPNGLVDPDLAMAAPFRAASITNPNVVTGFTDVQDLEYYDFDVSIFGTPDVADVVGPLASCLGSPVCNEAMHPSVAGHAALGRCLGRALELDVTAVGCYRSSSGATEADRTTVAALDYAVALADPWTPPSSTVVTVDDNDTQVGASGVARTLSAFDLGSQTALTVSIDSVEIFVRQPSCSATRATYTVEAGDFRSSFDLDRVSGEHTCRQLNSRVTLHTWRPSTALTVELGTGPELRVVVESATDAHLVGAVRLTSS